MQQCRSFYVEFCFFINSVLLGFGLAMDTFSVSLANGLSEPQMKYRRMSLIAGIYATFQFVMPMLGWGCICTVVACFTIFKKFIPCVAFLLLLYVGGKMLFAGIRCKNYEQCDNKKLKFSTLIIQGFATSIDALSVGFANAEYNALMAFVSASIIAVVTFATSIVGLLAGKKVGTKLNGIAVILGGIILIGIGIEIFIKGIFNL
ncbi:MAG: manganese efflux pump [Treponema sp.]|nr:manganese efflux pump [Treponema sp.]